MQNFSKLALSVGLTASQLSNSAPYLAIFILILTGVAAATGSVLHVAVLAAVTLGVAIGIRTEEIQLARIAAIGATGFLLMQPVLIDWIGRRASFGDELIALSIPGLLLVIGLVADRQPFRTPMTPWFLAYGGLLFTSGVRNAVPLPIILFGILATAKGMTAYYAGFHLKPDTRGFLSFIVVFVGAVIASIALNVTVDLMPRKVVAVLNLAPVSTSGGGERWTGIFTHPKEYGQILMILVCSSLGLCLSWLRDHGLRVPSALGRDKLVWLAVGVGLLGVYGLTLSRTLGSFLGLAAIFGVIFAWKLPKLIPPLIIFGIAGLIPLASMPLPDALDYRVDGIRDGIEMIRDGEFSGNYSWRVYNIYMTSQVLRDNPVLGVGPGRWGGFIAKSRDSPEYDSYDFKPFILERLAGLDVDWLRTLGEGGFALGLTLLIGLLYLWWTALAAVRILPTWEQRGLAAGILFFNTFIIVETISAQVFESPFVSFYFWGFNGVLAAWLVEASNLENTTET